MFVDHLQKKKKKNERIQKCKETGDWRYIYQNELDKACFQHYMADGDFKYLTRRTESDFFDKQTSGSSIKGKTISNKKLAE